METTERLVAFFSRELVDMFAKGIKENRDEPVTEEDIQEIQEELKAFLFNTSLKQDVFLAGTEYLNTLKGKII